MMGGINELTTRRDMRSPSTSVNAKTQDYLITTMKLRDRVLTARSQGQNQNRKKIRNMRSAPPFQNRNLDNYPMPYNREDSVRSARGIRTENRDMNSRMAKTRTDSGLMREYGKQMFDFTVKNLKNSRYDITRRAPSRTTLDNEHIVSTTNGPTPDGSILHNRKQKVLNSIRIRPHMEYESKYHHERAGSALSLQHTISDKNRHYRVRSVIDGIGPTSEVGNVSVAGSDFIFIPLDQSSELNGMNSRRATIDTTLSEYNEIETIFGKDPFDDIDERDSSFSEDFKPTNQSTRMLLPPDISTNLRLVSLDEESSSESEEEKEVPVVEVKKPEPPPPPKQTARKKHDPEPEPEPINVKLILKGPHCWVDDATVTSELSEDEGEDTVDGINCISGQSQQPDINTDKQNSAPKLDNISNKFKAFQKNNVTTNTKPLVSPTLKQPNQQAMKDAFDKTVQSVQSKPTDVINNNNNNEIINAQTQTLDNEVSKTDETNFMEECTGNEILLPTFICPSSEKKSREAALKDWLAHTCFRTGHRSVPVL